MYDGRKTIEIVVIMGTVKLMDPLRLYNSGKLNEIAVIVRNTINTAT